MKRSENRRNNGNGTFTHTVQNGDGSGRSRTYKPGFVKSTTISRKSWSGKKR